jgi:membrane fusion protein (multidrug efflux system)
LYVDAWPEKYFTGTIDAIEPKVELATRSVRVRGLVNNDAGELVPGMFARIEILLPVQTQVVTLPQAAIVYSPYGDSVYALQAQPGDETVFSVVNTLVVLGATRGDQVAIESGLSAGVTVVTAGQQKLRNGAQVSVDNTVPVSNNPAPQPDNN